MLVMLGQMSCVCVLFSFCVDVIKHYRKTADQLSHRLSGLIIDAFGELRDQQEQVKEDMEVRLKLHISRNLNCNTCNNILFHILFHMELPHSKYNTIYINMHGNCITKISMLKSCSFILPTFHRYCFHSVLRLDWVL